MESQLPTIFNISTSPAKWSIGSKYQNDYHGVSFINMTNGTFSYEDFVERRLQVFWGLHVYGFAIGFFLCAFTSFFCALRLRGQFYPQHRYLLYTCGLLILIGLSRTVFLLLDAYGVMRRLPVPILGILHSLTYPALTAALAMSVFAMASFSLRRDPSKLLYGLIVFHHLLCATLAVLEGLPMSHDADVSHSMGHAVYARHRLLALDGSQIALAADSENKLFAVDAIEPPPPPPQRRKVTHSWRVKSPQTNNVPNNATMVRKPGVEANGPATIVQISSQPNNFVDAANSLVVERRLAAPKNITYDGSKTTLLRGNFVTDDSNDFLTYRSKRVLVEPVLSQQQRGQTNHPLQKNLSNRTLATGSQKHESFSTMQMWRQISIVILRILATFCCGISMWIVYLFSCFRSEIHGMVRASQKQARAARLISKLEPAGRPLAAQRLYNRIFPRRDDAAVAAAAAAAAGGTESCTAVAALSGMLVLGGNFHAPALTSSSSGGGRQSLKPGAIMTLSAPSTSVNAVLRAKLALLTPIKNARKNVAAKTNSSNLASPRQPKTPLLGKTSIPLKKSTDPNNTVSPETTTTASTLEVSNGVSTTLSAPAAMLGLSPIRNSLQPEIIVASADLQVSVITAESVVTESATAVLVIAQTTDQNSSADLAKQETFSSTSPSSEGPWKRTSSAAISKVSVSISEPNFTVGHKDSTTSDAQSRVIEQSGYVAVTSETTNDEDDEKTDDENTLLNQTGAASRDNQPAQADKRQHGRRRRRHTLAMPTSQSADGTDKRGEQQQVVPHDDAAADNNASGAIPTIMYEKKNQSPYVSLHTLEDWAIDGSSLETASPLLMMAVAAASSARAAATSTTVAKAASDVAPPSSVPEQKKQKTAAALSPPQNDALPMRTINTIPAPAPAASTEQQPASAPTEPSPPGRTLVESPSTTTQLPSAASAIPKPIIHTPVAPPGNSTTSGGGGNPRYFVGNTTQTQRPSVNFANLPTSLSLAPPTTLDGRSSFTTSAPVAPRNNSISNNSDWMRRPSQRLLSTSTAVPTGEDRERSPSNVLRDVFINRRFSSRDDGGVSELTAFIRYHYYVILTHIIVSVLYIYSLYALPFDIGHVPDLYNLEQWYTFTSVSRFMELLQCTVIGYLIVNKPTLLELLPVKPRKNIF